MRKIILIFLFFLVCYAAKSQNDTLMPYKNSLRYEILPAFNSVFSIGFEQYCTPVSSVMIMPSVMYRERDTLTRQGFMFEVQYRYHVINRTSRNGKSIYSYYVSPYAAGKFFSIEGIYYESKWDPMYQYYYTQSKTYIDEFSAFGIGIIGGYEITFAKKLFIDTYIGGGLRTSDSERSRDNMIEPGFRGIAPRIGFSIGVRF